MSGSSFLKNSPAEVEKEDITVYITFNGTELQYEYILRENDEDIILWEEE